MSGVEVIRAISLGEFPHGFLGRRGGVSGGELAGLNVGYGSGDDRSAIDENRRLAIAALLDGAELATVHQVHSAEVVHADRPWPQDNRARADAMVTDRPNLLLGILTADCAPVLFADHRAAIVGAAHAGWRGALAGITDSTIAGLEGRTSTPLWARASARILTKWTRRFATASSTMSPTTRASSSPVRRESHISTWKPTSCTG